MLHLAALALVTGSLRWGRPWLYRLREVPAPPHAVPDGANGRYITVRDRRIHVTPVPQYHFVDDVRAGTDGSLLIMRRTTTDMWTTNYFLRVHGRERLMAYDGYEGFICDFFDAD